MRLSIHIYSGRTEQDYVYPGALLKYLQFLKLLNGYRLIILYLCSVSNGTIQFFPCIFISFFLTA